MYYWYNKGKVHFIPLMYPSIGNLTPNVYFLVDDPPWSCIRVPPWTFRPHARHFRRKSCHVQRTVTFNMVYIPKLPPTSSNPHITISCPSKTSLSNFVPHLTSLCTQKEEGEEECDIDLPILVPTRHQYSLNQTEKASECLFHSFFVLSI